jgi:protein arginine kinase activator
MLCDVCKKNEATVHLTQIVDNKMQTIDLCESCSKAKGVDDPTGFSLAGLLLGLGSNQEGQPPVTEGDLKCPRCNFSLADFKKAGRLGCAECYTTFAEPLQGLLKSMHKGTRHMGKVPATVKQRRDKTDELQSLQRQLTQAVQAEDFEKAAVLRDQIKQYKEQMGNVTHG